MQAEKKESNPAKNAAGYVTVSLNIYSQILHLNFCKTGLKPKQEPNAMTSR
jgi:hypothetical protein